MRSVTVTAVLLAVLALVGAALTLAVPAAAATGTAYTWTGGGATDDWTDSGNWAPRGIPGTGDSALIQAPSDAVCYAHVTAVPTGLHLADLTLDEHLYQGNADNPCLTSLAGGSITITHTLLFHAGLLASPLTIATGATGTITPGAAHDTTHIGAGGVVVDGSLTLANNRLAGAGGVDQHLSMSGGPGITVDAGATLVATGSNEVAADCCSNPAHLVNRGTVQLSGALALDAVELDQDHVLNATNGATLVTDFAPQTAADGATWTGSGSWLMSYTSTITVSGTQTLDPGFTWILGGNGSTSDEHLLGTFTLAGSGHFAWDGGTVGAAMTIGHGITATAAGAPTADPRRLDGLDATDPVAVTNHGSLTFAADAGWRAVNAGRIVNAADGTVTLTPGLTSAADCCAATTSALVNSGQVVVPPATGTAKTVTLGNIGYQATGGSVTIAPGDVVALTGGGTGSLVSTTVTGGGTLSIAEPFTASGATTVGASTSVYLATAGTIASVAKGSASLVGPGRFRWIGGTLSGVVTLATTGGQVLSGTAGKYVTPTPAGTASTLTFAGPTTIAAGTAKVADSLTSQPGTRLRFTGALSVAGFIQLSGGAITTSGTTTVAATTGSAYLTGNATFVNTGALTVRSGTFASDQDLVQTAGSTTVATGATEQTLGSGAAVRISGGSLAGTGRVAGNVIVGAGVLAPGTGGVGTFTITGALTAGSTSTVQLDLGASSRDQLTVGGTATLRGALRLTDLAGYQPTTGAVVTVLTAGSVSARFTCVATTGAGAGTQHWAAKPTATQLQLVSQAGAATSC